MLAIGGVLQGGHAIVTGPNVGTPAAGEPRELPLLSRVQCSVEPSGDCVRPHCCVKPACRPTRRIFFARNASTVRRDIDSAMCVIGPRGAIPCELAGLASTCQSDVLGELTADEHDDARLAASGAAIEQGPPAKDCQFRHRTCCCFPRAARFFAKRKLELFVNRAAVVAELELHRLCLAIASTSLKLCAPACPVYIAESSILSP